ncbi:MAG: DnaA/Hda family protein, partial [Chloroflexi bacterium]|nr:DnaA/Hda family protein [Chloroflexota bacterium]
MNANQIWQAALSDLRSQTSQANYETWLKNTSIVAFDGKGPVLIGVPNTFAKQWIEGRFAEKITKTLSNIIGRPITVQFTVNYAGGEDEDGEEAPVSSLDALPEPIVMKNPDDGRTDASGSSRLNPRYVFDRFIVGSSNRLAHAASLAVAENPAHAYNPLFLYGGVGLGKTHLLHAIAEYIS